MSEEENYKKLDFINNLVKPWDTLFLFLLQPYSLDPKFSDPVISARSLAIATSHQWDADKNDRGKGIVNSELRIESSASMRIKDLCNSIKHIKRNGGSHAKITGISAQVILDNQNKYRFLRNQIIYTHKEDGEFDLLEDM